ncbi:MAG: hypothetical protein K2G45_09010 [Lachnospiraceae bacterium]|nr:hypothetical protein [Lachnospiraceae bacterium]
MILKRKMKLLMPLALLGCMLFSVISLASSYSETKSNGRFELYCTIIYTQSSGGAKTTGAPYGYNQTANVIIYDSNGVSIDGTGHNTSYDKVASASVSTKKTVYKVVTGHFVTDNDKNPVYPLYQQIQLVKNPTKSD